MRLGRVAYRMFARKPICLQPSPRPHLGAVCPVRGASTGDSSVTIVTAELLRKRGDMQGELDCDASSDRATRDGFAADIFDELDRTEQSHRASFVSQGELSTRTQCLTT